MLIHMHTRERCRSGARKWLQPLTGSKFAVDLWPVAAVPRHTEIVCQGDQQRASGRGFSLLGRHQGLSLSLSWEFFL